MVDYNESVARELGVTALLTVKNLSIGFGGDAPVVEDVSFTVEAGKTLALVGESGSGKTLSCRSALRILPAAAQVRSGSIVLCDREGQNPVELMTLSERKMQDIRGNRVSMIFQEPLSALNPLMRIGDQIAEVFEAHDLLSPAERRKRALELLRAVGLPDPDTTMKSPLV